MKRFKRSDYVEVDKVYSGTSAAFVGVNLITGKKGIYKENGCMLGIDNEDVRERLASDILNSVGIECADIDLVYDETTKQNACFSNYIITDDERLIEPWCHNFVVKSDDKIDNFVEKYIQGVKAVTNNKKFLKECRKNTYKKIYMGCILDQYDIKPDNLPIVYNDKTGKAKIAAWFDNATAFKEDSLQKQDFFDSISSDEVFSQLFTKHYNEIKELANKVESVLSEENINKLFSADYVKDAFSDKEVESIKSRFKRQVEKSNFFLSRKKQNKVRKVFGKITSFFNKKDDTKKLKAAYDNIKEIKNVNYSFSEELRSGVNDDKEIANFEIQGESIEKEPDLTQRYNDISKRY